jgi:hypothetical protein
MDGINGTTCYDMSQRGMVYPGQRVLALDLARGFTVAFIPMIHVVMLYGSEEVHAGWLGFILSLIAEWPGGQLLMFLMGMSISFSKRSTKQLLIRAAVVFAAGYFLNFLKYVLPFWLGLLPAPFIQDLYFAHEGSTAVRL